MRVAPLAFAALAVATLASARADCPFGPGQSYDVVPLAGLEGLSFRTVAINDAGEVAGRIFVDAPDPDLAFVWRDGAVVATLPLGPGAAVQGLNDDGVVVGVGGTVGAAAVGASMFLWSSRTGAVQPVVAPIEVFPRTVNTSGLIVGVDDAGLQGFALHAPTGAFSSIAFGEVPMIGVGTLGAFAVSDSGLVVGAEVVFLPKQGYFEERPYTWTAAGGIEGLPTLDPGFGGRAVDVNEAGDAAGLVFDEFAGKQTALWPAGAPGVQNLGSPFNFFVSEATAINGSRHIAVVAPNDLFGFTRAFVWDDGTFIDLSCFVTTPGLFAVRPVDLNDAGDVLVELSDSQGLFILDTVIMRRPPCAGDVDGSGTVDFADVLAVLTAWGPCPAPCPEDTDADGAVGFSDLLAVLGNWGPCP